MVTATSLLVKCSFLVLKIVFLFVSVVEITFDFNVFKYGYLLSKRKK